MKPKEDSPQSVLKPCPFCGLHVELVSVKTYPNGERSPSYIKCKRCNYHIAGYEDKDVISQWNTRSAIRKEFCPNCEAETPCTHEAELYVCDICGEDFAKYIVSRNCNVSDVSITQDVTTPEPPEGACGMSEISEKAIKKDVPFITYIIHDKNMKNGRTVTVYKPTQEYYILFELIKFRRLPSTFPDIGITVISEGLEPSPSDVSVTEDVLTDIKTPRSIENNNPDYYKHDVGKWIPIASGRLPEKFQECIVLAKNKRVHNWIHDDALLPLFAQFTHWMPLPEPPEVTE